MPQPADSFNISELGLFYSKSMRGLIIFARQSSSSAVPTVSSRVLRFSFKCDSSKLTSPSSSSFSFDATNIVEALLPRALPPQRTVPASFPAQQSLFVPLSRLSHVVSSSLEGLSVPH